MNIENLTIGQARQLAAMLASPAAVPVQPPTLTAGLVGTTAIIRTYSAGVWCGTVAEKAGNEVILTDARRMWRWWAGESISLSGVAVHGIKRNKSRIAPVVPRVWLEAIEIIPVCGSALDSIMGAPNAQAE